MSDDKEDRRIHNPATVADLRPEVAAFALLIERELRINDFKGGWKKCTRDFLISKLREEVAELEYSIGAPCAHCGEGKGRALREPNERASVRSEAADVAAIAMMIADNIGKMMSEPQPCANCGALMRPDSDPCVCAEAQP